MIKVGLGHGLTAWYTFSKKLRIPFNIFAMAEVAMDVPNKRYYIENCKY